MLGTLSFDQRSIMFNKIRKRCTRTMKIMSLAGVNNMDVISGKFLFIRRVHPNINVFF